MAMYRVLAVLVAMVWVGACSTYSVKHDYDRHYNFARLKTYDWQPSPRQGYPGRVNLARIRETVGEQLAAKGVVRRVESPDFLIAAYVCSQDRYDVVESGYSVGTGRGWFGARPLAVTEYEEGTLVLDFVDPHTRELIWRGSASRALHDVSTREKADQIVNESVAAILKEFPPRAQ